MRNFFNSFDLVDVINIQEAGRKPCVHVEDLAIDQCCDRQVVKQVRELLPYCRTPIFPLTLNIKAVDLSDLPSLMVAAEQSEPARIP